MSAILFTVYCTKTFWFLRARLSHRNYVCPSVRPTVRPFVCHMGGSVKNGAC